MLYFIDDINLPYVETYGTQNSIELLRMIMDHSFVYDREDPGSRKDFQDLQFLAAMNPTAGSFNINERAQRHFATFAAVMPEEAELVSIYSNILVAHFDGFSSAVRKLVPVAVELAVKLHTTVAARFLPSAIRFVCECAPQAAKAWKRRGLPAVTLAPAPRTDNWNMRELRNIFEGLSLAIPAVYSEPMQLMRLLLHESYRVFADRMINESDLDRFDEAVREVMKRVPDVSADAALEAPLVFSRFVGSKPGVYSDVTSGESGRAALKAALEQRLEEYNDSNPIMNLVLFDQVRRRGLRPRGRGCLRWSA